MYQKLFLCTFSFERIHFLRNVFCYNFLFLIWANCAAPWIIKLWNIFVVLIIFCRTSWICILVTGKKSCGIDMVYCWFSTESHYPRKSFCFEYKKIQGYDKKMQIITDIIKHTVCQQYLEWMSWFKCQSLSFLIFLTLAQKWNCIHLLSFRDRYMNKKASHVW